MASHDVARSRVVALVRNVGELHAGGQAQVLGHQMGGRALASGRIGEFERLRSRQPHQFRQRAHRQRGVHHQHERKGRDQGDRRDVLQGVVDRLLLASRGRGEHAGCADEQGVPVGRCLEQRLDTDHARSTGPVLDQHRPAECITEPHGDHASGRVDRSARRERNDHAQGPCRPSRRRSLGCQHGKRHSRRQTCAGQQTDRQQRASLHVSTPRAAVLWTTPRATLKGTAGTSRPSLSSRPRTPRR